MKIYGIKTCGSVKKAIQFCKNHSLDYEFIDFRTTPLSKEKIEKWLTKVPLEVLLNTKGTTYRTLKLKELALDDGAKIDWLAKENLLIKRPVIEFEDSLIVGFDETKYRSIFC